MSYDLKILDLKCDGAIPPDGNETINEAREKLQKCTEKAQRALEIMLRPEFAKGMFTSAVECATPKIRHSIVKTAVAARKIKFNEKRYFLYVDNAKDNAYMSCLSIAILYQVPAKIFNLLLSNSKIDCISLESVALCYGYYLNWFGWALLKDKEHFNDMFLVKITIERNGNFFTPDQPKEIVLDNAQILADMLARKINCSDYALIQTTCNDLFFMDKITLVKQNGVYGLRLANLVLLLNAVPPKKDLVYHCSAILRAIFDCVKNASNDYVSRLMVSLANQFIKYTFDIIQDPKVSDGIKYEIKRANFTYSYPLADTQQKLLLWAYSDNLNQPAPVEKQESIRNRVFLS